MNFQVVTHPYYRFYRHDTHDISTFFTGITISIGYIEFNSYAGCVKFSENSEKKREESANLTDINNAFVAEHPPVFPVTHVCYWRLDS